MRNLTVTLQRSNRVRNINHGPDMVVYKFQIVLHTQIFCVWCNLNSLSRRIFDSQRINLTVSKPCKGLQIIRSTMVDSAPRFDYLNPIILFYIYVREFLREFVLQELLLDNPYFLYLPLLNPLPLAWTSDLCS